MKKKWKLFIFGKRKRKRRGNMEMKAEICKMEILCKNKNKIGMVFFPAE